MSCFISPGQRAPEFLFIFFCFLAAGFIQTVDTAPSSAQGMVLAIDELTGPEKTIVEIPIRAVHPKNLGPLQFRVTYDPAVIAIKDVVTGDDYPGDLRFANDDPGNLDLFMTSNADEGVNHDGVIAVIKAEIIGPQNASTPLGLEFIEAFERDTSRPISIDTKPDSGMLTVTAPRFEWWMLAAIAGGLIVLGMAVGLVRKMSRPGGSVQQQPGQSQSARNFCSGCGTPAADGSKFCRNCGQQI